MKIAVSSDHAGFALKRLVIGYLLDSGIEHQDVGCYSEDRVDYVDYAEKALEKFISGECDRSVLLCGSGLGMAIVANKYRGVRATPCYDEYTAEMSRRHNDSNCLALGARTVPIDDSLKIVKVWLETEFEGGRHQKRIDKIIKLEEKNFK
jgi:ribose 5-phosphate isomerase B